MLQAAGSGLNGIYKNLVDAFSGSLSWEWDDRFNGVLATFETKDKDRVSGIVNAQLTQVWDSATISDAPGSISSAIQLFGGLGPGQLLFHSDLTQDVILLGLWWPWGNGATISIRFVPYCQDLSDGEKQDVQAALRGAFRL